MGEKLEFTHEELSAGFTEWERRYREEPERFMNEVERLGVPVESYGEACAAVLLAVIQEQRGTGPLVTREGE